MDFRRLMARVCTILIPTCVSEAVQNRQIARINTKMRPSAEGVKVNEVLMINRGGNNDLW